MEGGQEGVPVHRDHVGPNWGLRRVSSMGYFMIFMIHVFFTFLDSVETNRKTVDFEQKMHRGTHRSLWGC